MLKFIMDKKSKEVIKEVISEILEFRESEIKRNNRFVDPFSYGKNDTMIKKENKQRTKQLIIEKFDKPLVKLNSLLKKEDQFEEVLEIEKQMRKIQAKKYITVKEFSEIYNIGKTSQQNYRGRLNDPLPYHQKVQGGKITYIVDEVEKWFENQHK